MADPAPMPVPIFGISDEAIVLVAGFALLAAVAVIAWLVTRRRR